MIPISDIISSDIEYKDEVLVLAKEAEDYLNRSQWCDAIISGSLAVDFGYILCVFYFEIKPTKDSGADDHVWMIAGDIPPAYIDFISATTAKEALCCYCELMEDWICHIENGQSVENCYPISAEPTRERAGLLKNRIKIIRSDVIPCVPDVSLLLP